MEKKTVKTTKKTEEKKTVRRKKSTETKVNKTGKYIYAIGRRKTSTVILKLYVNGSGNFVVKTKNKEVSLKEYFGGYKFLFDNALSPFKVLEGDYGKMFDAEIVCRGGGISGQSDAIKLAFARALVEYDEGLKTDLKQAGMLKRDPREKERKKPGLRKARRAPQWSKR